MYLGDMVGAPLFPIYLWVTLGNGIRFGNFYLYLSAILSATSFALVALASNAWDINNNAATVFGLAVGLLVVPAYVGNPLNKQRETLRALEEANRAKTEFIARVNHELRTPLNGVIAVADLLAEEEITQRQHRLLDMIKSSASTQLGLVNRILDVSKLAAGEMDRANEAFQPTAVIKEIYDVIKPQLQNSPVSFQVYIDPDVDPTLIGSTEHLRQILVNLTGNAVKFTHRGQIKLHLRTLSQSTTQQQLRFEIHDSGIGIPEERLRAVFDPFAQVDTGVSRRYGGTGLGLAIAAQLTRLLNGA